MDDEISPVRASHKVLVVQLAKPGDQVLSDMTAHSAHLLHMAVGISGEVGELLEELDDAALEDRDFDRVNVIEELGDTFFYMEGLTGSLGVEFFCEACPGTTPDELPEPVMLAVQASIHASKLLDQIKKIAVYNRLPDPRVLATPIATLGAALDAIMVKIGVTHDEVLQANIDKLRKRYPEGYSNKAAEVRADKVVHPGSEQVQ